MYHDTEQNRGNGQPLVNAHTHKIRRLWLSAKRFFYKTEDAGENEIDTGQE